MQIKQQNVEMNPSHKMKQSTVKKTFLLPQSFHFVQIFNIYNYDPSNK